MPPVMCTVGMGGRGGGSDWALVVGTQHARSSTPVPAPPLRTPHTHILPTHIPTPPPLRSHTTATPPAVYPDGKVCISILHPPGVDAHNAGETADERWRPIIGVEAVLISVLSMFADPNINSPANIDAGKQLRDDPKAFKRRVRQTIERSLEG